MLTTKMTVLSLLSIIIILMISSIFHDNSIEDVVYLVVVTTALIKIRSIKGA